MEIWHVTIPTDGRHPLFPGEADRRRAIHALGRVARGSLAHICVVDDHIHLVGYVIRQPNRHGLPGRPALWTGSAYLDLVGARVVPGLDLRLLEVLPRLRPGRLCQAVGLEVRGIDTMHLPELREKGAFELTSAAGAALAARPDLQGNEPSVIAARVAVVRIAKAAGIGASEIRTALGVSSRTIRRLASHETSRRILDAVPRRMALEALVAATEIRR